ncbi:LysR family transcriptional regulator, partial [Sinorhizobium meliloti]
ARRLVPASADEGWNLDLEIRLYRHVASRNRKVEELWATAQRLLEPAPA